MFTESTLRKFLDEEEKINGTYLVHLTVVEGEHQALTKMAKEVDNTHTLATVAKKHSIVPNQVTTFSRNNEYNIDFGNADKGQLVHYMSSDGDMKMALLQISDKENVKSSLFSIKKNRDVVTNVYFSRNYTSVRSQLVNKLITLYPVVQ
ncbi:hypothetical protein [Lacticaseibacillus zhaodongensis]|uniref:hypothetical protein n=1 Tax=Lacticaseibacillus zhaodongensis TaxID=2668065 RepID=UPI0012D2A55F|nr:hypothetical protein [Lacticaseibacillus zhaodongensis]